MSQSFQQLPVKTLVKILARLRGGEIGFDPYRDERTNKKEKLLAFILSNHGNSEIVEATQSVLGEAESAPKESETDTKPGQQAYLEVMACGVVDHPHATRMPVVVTYKDVNRESHIIGFRDLASADDWVRLNPMNQYTGKRVNPAYSYHATEAAVKREKMPEAPKVETQDQTPEALQIAAMLSKLATKASVDETKVVELLDARAQQYVDNILDAVNSRLAGYDAKIDSLQFPTTVNILPAPDAKPVNLGLQHKNFATLLKMSQARMRDGMRLNIWLKGPAGSGKTTAAAKVAEALGMKFHFNGAISTEYELMGFKDAAGTYHRTAFRDAFEHGGIYLFDEVDSSLPKAVLAFNAALANGRCAFPDQQVARHKDCVVIAGANTAGNGASSDYVGRMKQDMAFLNRFVMLDWPLDEALEKSLASNKDWVRKVQRYRKNADSRKIKGHIISPRATFYGEALLAAGLDEEIVEQAVLRGALNDEQWGQLCQ